MGLESDTGFFNTVASFFSRRSFFLLKIVKNVLFCLNELLVNFREESSGIGRFFRLEIPSHSYDPHSFDEKAKLGQLVIIIHQYFRASSSQIVWDTVSYTHLTLPTTPYV